MVSLVHSDEGRASSRCVKRNIAVHCRSRPAESKPETRTGATSSAALPRDPPGRYVRRVSQSPASEASPAWIRPSRPRAMWSAA